MCWGGALTQYMNQKIQRLKLFLLIYVLCNLTTRFSIFSAPSGPPRELSVHPTGDQSLKVTWKVSKIY